MAQEGAGHTFQPTALVHEAWLRLGACAVDTAEECDWCTRRTDAYPLRTTRRRPAVVARGAMRLEIVSTSASRAGCSSFCAPVRNVCSSSDWQITVVKRGLRGEFPA